MKIQTESQLRKLYGWPQGRAGKKVLPELEKHSINFINHSPFVIFSTHDEMGKSDASPRGGAPGFIHIQDNNTLVIPDAKGNNRVDSLVNIVETGSLGLLFLISGIEETLRVNGKAEIRTDEGLLVLFQHEKNPPKTCIVLHIEEVFLHCAKAFMRSKLWDPEFATKKVDFPSMGKMLNDQLNTDKPEESYEEMKKRYAPDL